MKTNNNNRENLNAANTGASYNKINDFGAKIGGARKDQYAAAREWAEKLADITAEALTKAGGVSKLVRLPNLESMTAAGAITADQARAALIIWRGIERKPAGSYRADRWAERTRARLEAAAAIITGTEPTADNVADIIKAARESAEFAVISAAQWPAEPFTFGNYSVSYSLYSEPRKLRIIGGRYYRGEASTDPADIVRQLREMTAADAEKAAESRARGPRLGVYHTSNYTRYFIAVENKCEIVLKVCDTYQEATEAARNERAELLARYENLRTFPALRRSWNRPRVGKEWHAEDVTPEQFAAALPFKGVEFGNWLNQDERAALLNSAFDGFHDLADLLGITPAAVSLGGMLNFSFATRGHAGSAAHFDSCYNTINLNKRNGAGCMAHEWLHACDHFAAVLAGRGSCTSWGEAFATECNKESDHPADIAARELVAAIRKMDYYTRSRNYQTISGKSQGGADYYTQPCELAARGFEGVVLYLLNCAGGCSDFLVNLQSWRDFERDDAGHRRDCYPYPSDAEAAALVPYYVAFFRALFGACQVSEKAAEGVAAATLQAAQEKAESDRRAAEKAEQERKESEERRAARRAELDRKAEEQRKENERKAAEVKAKAEATRTAIVERLTAAHFDTIATDCDAAAVYFAAHLEGEIYTGKADIKSDPAEIAATVQAAPVACLLYKYIHNAKRVICHRWQVASVRSNKRTARELLESLQPSEVRAICRAFVDFERADNWQKAAKIYADTMRSREALNKRTQKPQGEPTANEPTECKGESVTTAQGLTVEKYSEKATVIRGYNAEQLAELLAMGGKEWHRLKGGKGVIFSTLRHADELREWMKQQAGEGTTAPAADQPAESVPAATLQQAGEITDTTNEPAAETLPEWATEGARVTILRNGEQLRGYITEIHKAFRGGHYLCTFHELGTLFNIPVNVSDCAPVEEPAAVLPEWLKVGARVRTRGRYMLSARTMRREWVEGEEMTVKEINGDFVRLENRREDGIITSSQGIATDKAAAELTPIYSASEKSQPAENLAEAVREWSANDYAATHHGATLTDWDKAHPAPVEWCKPGQVFKLAGRQIAGRDVYAIITKLGLDCFFYVGNFGSCSERLTAYNCQKWENLQPVEIMHEDTPKFAKMFQKFHDIRKAWEADGVKIWQEREDKERTADTLQEPAAIAASIDTNEDTADTLQEAGEITAPAATYETSATADEQQQADALPFMEKAAILDKVTARIYAPWGDVSKMWLCPFRGANDVWNAWARRYNFRDFGRLAEWALTAKAGERAELCGLLVQIWERDGQTAAEPESEADRLTANRETRERLRAAIVAELEAVGAYLYPFDNEMKVFGKVENVADLYKVEDIARRYSSAKFIHEDRAAVFEFNFPLFFPHFFPTDPAPEPSGEGETEAAPRYSNGEKSERTKTRGQVFAQYFRILHQLTDGKTWESETNRDRAARILDALNRYKDNFAKVPEIARLFASVTERTDDGRDPVEVLNAIPVRRSVYMGIEKPRRKSMSDICGQAADILREIYNAGRSESNSRRYNRVEAIQERYLTNIAQNLGYPSYHEFTGISSRTRYKTKERKQVDKDYYTKVGRDVYVASFDVDRIRKAETWDELNPLRNSLYYQNVRPCEGCPFSASTAFCPYTGGATVEQCKERILSVIAPKSSKPIRTKAQRAHGKTRCEINAQSFRLSQHYRYGTPRYRRISEITERYLRAISCQAIGSANYTQMTEKQCDVRHPRAIYMQPKSADRYALTLNGYVIKEGLSLHEARIIYKSYDKEHRRRMHLHHN